MRKTYQVNWEQMQKKLCNRSTITNFFLRLIVFGEYKNYRSWHSKRKLERIVEKRLRCIDHVSRMTK